MMALIAWLIGLQSSHLLRIGIAYAAIFVASAEIFAPAATFPAIVASTFTFRRADHVRVALSYVDGYLIELTIAAFAVATLMAFDRRSVNRAAVDLRVWQRQQTRRRQLLRQWHRSHDVPEVAE
jgi:hypothetical protein